MSVSAQTGPAARPGRHRADVGRPVVIAVAAALAVAAVAKVTADGLVQPEVAVIFGALVALGELFRMVIPGNREVAPIAAAGALGYAMLTTVGPEPAGHSALQAIAVTAVGMLAGSLPHIAVGRAPRPDAMARRLLTGAVVAVAFRPLASLELGWTALLCLMTVTIVAACFLEVCVAALIRAEAVRARFGIALRDEMAAKMALCAAIGATAMLIVVATSVMGRAALLVFTAPILVTQFAFRRYAGIRATYLQTVRALSRVTEVGGYVEAGHSRRVSKLAVAMGRELGMSEGELLELEYAALMHDIGQLSLGDPIPGGATVLASPDERRRIAELGAEVIKETGVLDRVAYIVRRQADPYRSDPAGEASPEPPPPLASRIIKAANAYDDLVGDSSDRDRGAAVLDRLRAESTAEYDPTVVEALARVVERRARS